MKAKKLKIHVKTSKFSIPIPALRFSTLRWISKMAFKYGPSKIRHGKMGQSGKPGMDAILENITPQDIEMILEHLEQEEPFELVNIDTWDENQEKVRVKIYTV